jgi:hypothetical protein
MLGFAETFFCSYSHGKVLSVTLERLLYTFVSLILTLPNKYRPEGPMFLSEVSRTEHGKVDSIKSFDRRSLNSMTVGNVNATPVLLSTQQKNM